MIDIPIDRNIKIADIGCGSGAQTFDISECFSSEITAVDLFPEFLEVINSRNNTSKTKAFIKTLQCSMDELPFPENEFDIIWSEGAIYNIGFKNGIQTWKKFLKPGGYLALSEITWLTHTRPIELEQYWNENYPEIDTASGKIQVLEENGFIVKGYFPIPESSWLDGYYKPIQERMDNFLKKYNHSEMAKNLISNEKKEIEIYTKYKNYYSYGFYIAQKY